jgi:hypothetical protein
MNTRPVQRHTTPVWRLSAIGAGLVAVCTSLGCGTTRWTDTSRTATEQLLISDAVDRAISHFDFSLLAGREVYFDASYLAGVTDEKYIVSSLRQHLLASGCVLRETKEESEFVVEARSGGIGTDRSDVLVGVPAVQVPVVPGMPLPSAIPELPLAKSTNQKAVAKLAVFAYNRRTGRPALQTGVDPVMSTAKNSWFFGAGPFKQGTLYERAPIAADKFDIPIIGGSAETDDPLATAVPVTDQAVFAEGFEPPPAAPAPPVEAVAAAAEPPVAAVEEAPVAQPLRYPVTQAQYVEAVDSAARSVPLPARRRTKAFAPQPR